MRLDGSIEVQILTYDEFVREMHSNGWQFLDNKTPHIITNKDTGIVSTYSIRAGGYGAFLELKCPQNQVIAINGKNQYPSLCHNISIICRDDTGFELPGNTRLSIMYLDSTSKPIENIWIFYDEISQTKGSRYKQEGERYYLKERGILLKERERLQVHVYESDIDIEKTDLFLKCDIFTKRIR